MRASNAPLPKAASALDITLYSLPGCFLNQQRTSSSGLPKCPRTGFCGLRRAPQPTGRREPGFLR